MSEDRIIFRKELMEIMKVTSETLRVWTKNGKLPAPDIHISSHVKGWKLSTLNNAGIGVV